MLLTEQVQKLHSPSLSHLCHLSKNLYNLANYYVRQEFFHLGNWLRYQDLWYMLKKHDAYGKLPAQTAQQTLRLLDRNWKSFFEAMKGWKKHPQKYRGRPSIPKYLRKDGETLATFTNQQCRIKGGLLHFPKKATLPPIKTRLEGDDLHQVRIVPKGTYYVVEIIYEQEVGDLHLDTDRIVGIDLGLNNIVTMGNNAGLKPAIIKGGVVKSVNQFYNKEVAKYRSKKDDQGYTFETRRLRKLTKDRNNKLHDFFHKASRKVIQYCKEHDFGTLVIGYNEGWKDRINLGKKTNQNFVQVSFLKLVQKIRYKAKLVGITVKLVNEDYTSKCSFLDGEAVGRHGHYKGKRVSRGLFQASDGTVLHADVNACYNIIEKAFPKAHWVDGIEGVGLHPYCLCV
jgi:putative transposase